MRLSSSSPECIHLVVRSLTRSINFYVLVLGFEVVDVVSRGADRRVRMRFGERCHLSVRECVDPRPRLARPGPTLPLRVDDLDDIRGRLWDFGLTVSRDSGTPDQIHRSPTRRSLYVRDPDGYEIEVIEPAGKAPDTPSPAAAAPDTGTRERDLKAPPTPRCPTAAETVRYSAPAA